MKIRGLIFFIFLISTILSSSHLFPQSLTWQKVFRRNSDNVDNTGYDICPLSDGKFLALNYFESPQGAYIIKLNEYGTFLDSVFVPGHFGYSCAPTSDNGFITIGRLHGLYSMKINSSCRVEWIKEYGNTTNMNCWKTIRTSDNNFIGVGGGENFDGVLVKIDASGNLIWQKSYMAGDSKEFRYVSETSDGKYLSIGWALDSPLDIVHGLIDKIDTSGNLIWEKRIDNVRNNFSINRINNQYILGVCFFDSIITNQTAGFIRIDSVGNILKQVRLPRDANYTTIHKDSKIINPNKFLFVNYRLRNTYDTLQAYVVITDSSGNVINTKLFPANVNSLLEKVYILDNGFFVFIGSSNHLYQGFDNIYVVKTDSLLNSPTVGITNQSQNIPNEYLVLETYPNPFNSQINIKYRVNKNGAYRLTLYDILGKEMHVLKNEKMQKGAFTINYDFSNLSSGIYFLKLIGENTFVTTKVVFFK